MGGSSNSGGDSLQHRDASEDSITIYYRMFDSSRIYRIDSSVNDYTKRFPLPAENIFLGNLGSPTRSLIFSPLLKPGFDAGFHAFDTYRFTVENTRIFQTTKPYTELDYLLGARSEQTIKVLHTQNINPNWNAAFQFRFISAPGFVKSSNTAHSNIRLSTSFTSKNKRYSGVAMYIANTNKASDNGGILSAEYLSDPNQAYKERFNIPTWLGGDASFGNNIFSTAVSTGSTQKSTQLYFRHQYDLGQTDSAYGEDSVMLHFFYPRFRLQHTFSYTSSEYNFDDAASTNATYNQVYQQRYGFTVISAPLSFSDKWTDLTNEAAIEIFPQKDNQDQFLKAGAGYQMLHGSFKGATENFSNIYLNGEYRNRTKSRKWDFQLNGKFYLAGLNAGDYKAGIRLQRDFGKKIGSLELSFQNINRSPSFIFDTRSSFLYTGDSSLLKENWTVFGANLYVSRLDLHLIGQYYLVSNYAYWDGYIHARQQNTIQNVLHIGAEKRFTLSRRWNWYAEAHFQKATGTDINLPLAYTRNRIVYEGSYFKNLYLAAGLEMRYFTPFTTDDWSPLNQQWVTQNTYRLANRPDVNAFLHFRVRGLRIYIRAENLNTVSFKNGFSFSHNNLAAPLYPVPAFMLKFGFYWSFVN